MRRRKAVRGSARDRLGRERAEGTEDDGRVGGRASVLVGVRVSRRAGERVGERAIERVSEWLNERGA